MDDFETRTFGKVTLVRGDCLDVMPLLKKGSVNLSFCDLPYGVTKNDWDSPINLALIWQNLLHACTARSTQVFTATQPFATAVINSKHEDFKYDLIWDKQLPSGFLNANRRPLRRHEHVLIFSAKGPSVYQPQKTQGVPYNHKRGAGSGLNYGSVKSHLPYASDGQRHPVSIQSFAVPRKGNIHPTQKPVALLEWLIRTYTNDGDTILDPVAGSGTTAIAAMNVGGGRNVICIEKDPTYFEVMCRRIAQHQQKMEAARE